MLRGRTRLISTPSGCRSGLPRWGARRLHGVERPLHPGNGEHGRVGHEHGPVRRRERAAGELAERGGAVDDHEPVGLVRGVIGVVAAVFRVARRVEHTRVRVVEARATRGSAG